MIKKLLFFAFVLASQFTKAQCTGMETYSNITVSQCDSYTTPSGIDLFVSGVYNDTIMNSNSCDSIITIDLTILVSTQSSISVRSCPTYTAPDGQVYSATGNYTATIPNDAGCDSVISIALVVESSSTISPSVCTSYLAPDNQTYTQSGTYTAVIPNSMGCDSTITINLTIKNTSSSSISVTRCGTYTAPDGQIYTTSGIKTAVIQNMAGCDSTITINLTINTIPVATASDQGDTLITATPSGLIYQWIDCDTDEEISSATNQVIEPVSGSYAVIVTGTNGCVDTSNCVTVSNNASLVEYESNFITSVFPNPTNGTLTILTTSNEAYEISVLDLNGKVLLKKNILDKTIELNVEQLKAGLYIVELKSQNTKELIRLIKQ